MTQIEKGLEVIHILKKFDGTVTKSTLSNLMGTTDREVRKIIEFINADNESKLKDYLVVSNSYEPGYKLARNEEDVLTYQREIESRIAALNVKMPKINYFKEIYRNAGQ